MVGSTRTSNPAQYSLSLGGGRTAPPPAAPRVQEPWETFQPQLPGLEVKTPPLAPVSEIKSKTESRLFSMTRAALACALSLSGLVGGLALIVPHHSNAAMTPSMSQVAEARIEIPPLPDPPKWNIAPLDKVALPDVPGAWWNDQWAQRGLVNQPPPALKHVPFSLLHADSLMMYDSKGHHFDVKGNPWPEVLPNASLAAHRTYPRVAVHKGDYVAHGVNFSTLLSNEEYVDSNSLTQPELQSLLEKNGSFLATYRQDGRSGAQIILAAAQKYKINPRVILATLEKENSLVSRQTTPAAWVLKSAMGYGYDDSGSSAGRHSTFAWQVDRGTQLLRTLFDEGNQTAMPARIQVDYGHRKITVNNAATFALMRYTPHTRDTQLHRVGGGNFLFHSALQRVNFQINQIEKPAEPPTRRAV